MSSPEKLAAVQYEFKRSEEELLGELAQKMWLVGCTMVVFGVLGVVAGVALLAMRGNGAAAIVQGVVSVFVGVWTARASTAFSQIVATQGRDIQHLMDGLQNLLHAYRLQAVMILIGLVLLGVAIVFVFLGSVMR